MRIDAAGLPIRYPPGELAGHKQTMPIDGDMKREVCGKRQQGRGGEGSAVQ